MDDEITNFNDFSMNIENECNEDNEHTSKLITLEDKNDYFYGNYNNSKNGKYIVAYGDSELDENNNEIGGQVYLIENGNKILWKMRLERPHEAFVTDTGKVIIVDWLSGDRFSSKLYFFNIGGEEVYEYLFSSNAWFGLISNDESEFILVTSFPKDAIYLFSIKENKLIKNVKNEILKTPLNFHKIDFDKIKNYIITGDYEAEEISKKPNYLSSEWEDLKNEDIEEYTKKIMAHADFNNNFSKNKKIGKKQIKEFIQKNFSEIYEEVNPEGLDCIAEQIISVILGG